MKQQILISRWIIGSFFYALFGLTVLVSLMSGDTDSKRKERVNKIIAFCSAGIMIYLFGAIMAPMFLKQLAQLCDYCGVTNFGSFLKLALGN